ncbi:hypothetical protein KAR91_07075 [Candidatus Pacearchaeota archaeon]|nr:hypothetical protein [Candidatus Pacearchaeota archaeon]
MKKLTKSQQDILDNLSSLNTSDLTLDMPFNIARRPMGCKSFWSREFETVIFIRGYAKAAEGLKNRGLLLRDSDNPFYWLTSFGIEYIKGLQR